MSDNQQIITHSHYFTAMSKIIIEPDGDAWTAHCPEISAMVGHGPTATHAELDLVKKVETWLQNIFATGLFKKSSLLDRIWNHFKEMSLFEIGQHFNETDSQNGLKNYINYLTLSGISVQVAYYHAAAVRAFHKLDPDFREKIKIMKLATLAQLPKQEINFILTEHRTSFYSTEELLAATVRQTRDSVKLFKHENNNQFLTKATLKNN